MFRSVLINMSKSINLMSRNISSVPENLWQLGKLNHVAIAVPDMDKAVSLYKNVLNATKVSEKIKVITGFFSPNFTFLNLHYNKAQPEHGVYTVFVELGNTKIELLYPLGEKSPIKAFLQKNSQGGIHHICIEVNNINEAMKTCKKNNIRCLSDEPRIGAHGKPVVFLHPKDCCGTLVELEQE